MLRSALSWLVWCLLSALLVLAPAGCLSDDESIQGGGTPFGSAGDVVDDDTVPLDDGEGAEEDVAPDPDLGVEIEAPCTMGDC